MSKLTQENIRVSYIALHGFYQTIFRWTKYCFESSSPSRVMNGQLYYDIQKRESTETILPIRMQTYFNNNSYYFYVNCSLKIKCKLKIVKHNTKMTYTTYLWDAQVSVHMLNSLLNFNYTWKVAIHYSFIIVHYGKFYSIFIETNPENFYSIDYDMIII